MSNSHRSRGLLLIAVFKLLKVAALILIGAGALRLIHAAIARITDVSPRKLEAIGVGLFIYATLFLTEGIGLL